MAIDSNWNNVVLLLPMEGYNNQTIILDSKKHFINTFGNAKITTTNPPTGCTSSLILDGNNDYLTTIGSDLALGSGDWAIEFPLYRAGETATSNDAVLMDFRTADTQVAIYLAVYGANAGANANKLQVYINGAVRITSTISMTTSWKWITLAKVGSGTNLKLFVDGVQDGSYADSNTYATTSLTIGGRYAAVSSDYRSFNGQIGPIRITTANGRGYSTAFTPPTLPYPVPKISGTVTGVNGSGMATTIFVRDRQTQKLSAGTTSNASTGVYSIYPPDFGEYIMYCTNDIVDPYWENNVFASRLNSAEFPTLSGNTLSVTGSVTVSSAVPDPFGGSDSSALFAGAGSYMLSDGTFLLGTSYTVSGWFRTTSLAVVQGVFFVGTYGSFANRTLLLIGTGGDAQFYSENGASVVTFYTASAASTISTNTWYHFSCVRNGKTALLLINGNLVSSILESGVETIGSTLYLGYGYSASTNRGFSGYIRDIKISNRVEQTNTFLPPTSTFLTGLQDGVAGKNAIIYDRIVPG